MAPGEHLFLYPKPVNLCHQKPHIVFYLTGNSLAIFLDHQRRHKIPTFLSIFCDLICHTLLRGLEKFSEVPVPCPSCLVTCQLILMRQIRLSDVYETYIDFHRKIHLLQNKYIID